MSLIEGCRPSFGFVLISVVLLGRALRDGRRGSEKVTGRVTVKLEPTPTSDETLIEPSMRARIVLVMCRPGRAGSASLKLTPRQALVRLTETGTGRKRIGLGEWLEQSRQECRVHAFSRVGDLELDQAPAPTVDVLVERGQADEDQALCGVLEAVGDEVEQHSAAPNDVSSLDSSCCAGDCTFEAPKHRPRHASPQATGPRSAL